MKYTEAKIKKAKAPKKIPIFSLDLINIFRDQVNKNIIYEILILNLLGDQLNHICPPIEQSF